MIHNWETMANEKMLEYTEMAKHDPSVCLTLKHRPVETRAQARARNRHPAAQPDDHEEPIPSDLYSDDEETRKRIRDQYRTMEPIHFDDNVSLYVERLMSLIPYMYRYKPPNSVLYNFLYAKCSKEVQELLSTSGAVEQGDYEALEEFLLAKVGRKSRPTNEFAELKRTRDKRTWKELIRQVEKMVNDESFGEAEEVPLAVKHKQYREKILQLCDEDLLEKLNDYGFLRPGKLDYEELCEFLYDQDINNTIMKNRKFREMDPLGEYADTFKTAMVSLGEFLDKSSPSHKRRFCTNCDSTNHYFSSCPSVQWYPRTEPLPPGVNATCVPNTKCWAPGCNGKSHWTRHCPNFDYRIMEQ